MKKTISRRLALAAIVVVTLVVALAYPVGMRLRQTSTALADSGANHQTSNKHFGVSGGNVNDISSAFCCSGTLGSLVTDGTDFFILSNNHVLARSDAAAPGEDISEPGLVDFQCTLPPIVADLTAFPLLGSNVDAAIAQLRTLTDGTYAMDTSGFIEDIGTISSAPKAPAVDQAVKKSGRTTGLTQGHVTSVSTNVKVQYQARCGQGKKFTISYTNQVVVAPGTFSAGGDSGSLIVTDEITNPQPVALLYAGSSTTTIGNPICDVLAKVSSSSGKTISFVGASGTSDCSGTSGSTPRGGPPRPHRGANDAKERYADQLMARPGVIGVGVGDTEDGSAPAVIMYVDDSAPRAPFVPAQLDGVPVRVIHTDTFVSR